MSSYATAASRTSSTSPPYHPQKRSQSSCSNFSSDERFHSPGQRSVYDRSAAQIQPAATASTSSSASSNSRETFEMGANSCHHQQQPLRQLHQQQQRMRQTHQLQQELMRQSHQQQQELLRQSHQQQEELMRQLHHHQQQLYHQQQNHYVSPQLEIHLPEGATGPMQPQKLTRNQKTKRRFTYLKRLQKRAEKRELEKEGNWTLFN